MGGKGKREREREKNSEKDRVRGLSGTRLSFHSQQSLNVWH